VIRDRCIDECSRSRLSAGPADTTDWETTSVGRDGGGGEMLISRRREGVDERIGVKSFLQLGVHGNSVMSGNGKVCVLHIINTITL
jgi:hypothetical protein